MMTSSEKMLMPAILCNQKNFWLYFWKENRLKIIPAKFRCIWISYKKIIKGGSNRPPPPQPTHAQKSPTVVGLSDPMIILVAFFIQCCLIFLMWFKKASVPFKEGELLSFWIPWSICHSILIKKVFKFLARTEIPVSFKCSLILFKGFLCWCYYFELTVYLFYYIFLLVFYLPHLL